MSTPHPVLSQELPAGGPLTTSVRLSPARQVAALVVPMLPVMLAAGDVGYRTFADQQFPVRLAWIGPVAIVIGVLVLAMLLVVRIDLDEQHIAVVRRLSRTRRFPTADVAGSLWVEELTISVSGTTVALLVLLDRGGHPLLRLHSRRFPVAGLRRAAGLLGARYPQTVCEPSRTREVVAAAPGAVPWTLRHPNIGVVALSLLVFAVVITVGLI